MKGAAIEASASERETPISAVLRAPQSFAPSPHIPTSILHAFYKFSTRTALSSGDILAYIYAFNNTLYNVCLYSGV